MNTGTLNEPTDVTAHISKVLAPRRSGFRIMSELIGLIRPLRGVMLLGITLGGAWLSLRDIPDRNRRLCAIHGNSTHTANLPDDNCTVTRHPALR